MNSKSEPFYIKDLVRTSWRSLLASPGLLFGATALYLMFIIRDPMLDWGKTTYTYVGVAAIATTLTILVTCVLSIILLAGLIKIFLMHHDGHKPSLAEIFRHRRIFGKFLFTEVMVALIVMIGLIFFVVPGIILAIKLNFAGYISVDKEIGPGEAMKESWRITQNRKWLIAKMILVIVLINIVASLANLGGLLVSVCLTLMIQISAYRALLNHPDNKVGVVIE